MTLHNDGLTLHVPENKFLVDVKKPEVEIKVLNRNYVITVDLLRPEKNFLPPVQQPNVDITVLNKNYTITVDLQRRANSVLSHTELDHIGTHTHAEIDAILDALVILESKIELLEGDIDGVNTEFSTSLPFVEGSTSVTINGLEQVVNVGYIEDGPGQKITFTTPPSNIGFSDVLLVKYLIAGS